MSQLEQLAIDTFEKTSGPLSESEKKVLRASQRGTLAKCGTERDPKDNDPSKYEN